MIKNIVFDVGEVLIGYRWKEMLLERGMTEERAEIIGNIMFGDDLWRKFDEALVPFEDVINEYQDKYAEYGDDIRWFITNGEKMCVQRPEMWDKLRELKNKGYNVYLLSNYSQVLFEQHTKESGFMELIDGKVISYEINILKPDRRIYEFLLEKYKLNAGECLFFDDKPENVETARKIGMKGIVVSSEEQLKMEVDKL